MKNDKGYTLVELLIALALLSIIMLEIFGVMQNSSKLYYNGTYEVELQTEAQQVIQQMNELLIDANNSVSANFDAASNSDRITISNNDAVYTIELTKADPSDEFGELFYTMTDLTGSGNSTPGPIPMAEYVNSISLNMTEYQKNNIVTLSVSMNNGKYSYNANQAIYLRNDIGSGKNTNYNLGSSYDYDLDILRYREYDLAEMFDTDTVTYTYAWKDECAGDASHSYYLDTNTNTLAASDSTNATDDFVGYFTLIATGSDGVSEIEIRISSQEVDFGTDHTGVMFANTESSYDFISAIPVSGVAIEEADNIEVTFVYQRNPMDGIERRIIPSPPTAQNQQVRYDYNDGTGRYAFMTLQQLRYSSNEAINTFELYSQKFEYNQGSGYQGYIIETGAPLYFEVKLYYNHRSNPITGTVYVYPYMLGESDMSEEAENIFWNAVGW